MLRQSSLDSFPKVLYWDGQHEIETLAFGRSEDGRLLVAVPNGGTPPPNRLLPYCPKHNLTWLSGSCPRCGGRDDQ